MQGEKEQGNLQRSLTSVLPLRAEPSAGHDLTRNTASLGLGFSAMGLYLCGRVALSWSAGAAERDSTFLVGGGAGAWPNLAVPVPSLAA